MEFFKVDGLWSSGKSKKKPMAGTLSYSKKGVRLKLMGGFKTNWSPMVDNNYPIIKGVVEQNPYGNFVTLYNSFTLKTSINSAGIGSETIYANRAILGDDHPPIGPYNYRSLKTRFTHLQDWVGWNNFKINWPPEGSKRLDVEYVEPEFLSYSVDDAVVKVCTSFSVSENIAGASIDQKTHLQIEGLGKTDAEKAGDKFLTRLQYLITLATDVPNEIDENLLYGDLTNFGTLQVPKKFYMLTRPAYRIKVQQKRIYTQDMLFELSDAQKAGLNIFQAWFDFIKRQEEFTTVYFAHLFQQPHFLDDKFRSVITTFSIFCASAYSSSERSVKFIGDIGTILSPSYDAQERMLLGQIIPNSSELDMPFHLLRLLDENREVMSKIISEDFQDFVTSVCLTLAFIDRRNSPVMDKVLQGSNLHYATEKLRWLMRVLILKELGFSDVQVNALSGRNRNFTELKYLG